MSEKKIVLEFDVNSLKLGEVEFLEDQMRAVAAVGHLDHAASAGQ